MATINKTIRYDLTANDRLTGPMARASEAMDAASRNARALDRALASQRKATDVAAGASLALAKADEILKEAEHGLAEGALEAEFALKKQEMAAKSAARQNAELSTSVAGLGAFFGNSSSGMLALVGAGTALSPVLVTLGTGMGGLAAAAYKTISPILQAGTATAKARKELAGLDPAQRSAYQSLTALKSQFSGFAKSLEPEVLGLFNRGLRITSGLLADVQPVAAATGKALGGFLGQVDAEFKSKTWQNFFGFMAVQAAPDMRLLGNAILPLLDTLPRLLTDIQPVAVQMLQMAAAAGKIVDASVRLDDRLKQIGTTADHSGGFLGHLADAAKRAVGQMFPGIPAAQKLTGELTKLGGTSVKAGGQVAGMGGNAAKAALKVLSLEQQVTGLTSAENKALTPLLNYSNALITQRDDAKNLNDALKTSHDRIGLNTAAQRASFSAANTYIQDLLNTAQAATKSHQGIDAQIRSIQGALPMLRNVRGGTKEYWQEVSTLVAWLHRLQGIKLISETVKVFGSGQWTRNAITGPGSTGGGHALAAGGRIPGYGGGDRWPALLEGGEAVVDKRTTAAHAAELRAWGVPGFASGGVVPSYAGSVRGLPPWGEHNRQATITQIVAGIAGAWAKAFKAALPGGIGNYHPGAGVQQWRGTVSRALSLAGSSQQLVDSVLYQMQTESGGNPYAVNRWDSNWFAGHPSVGLMQVIRGTFQAYAGRFRGTGPFAYGVSENPLANVYAAIRYAQANYGPGLRNAYGGIGSGHGYAYGTSSAAPGWAWVGERGPELVRFRGGERVTPAGGGGNTYNITVNVPLAASKATIGREVVEAIREYERGSGKGWRK